MYGTKLVNKCHGSKARKLPKKYTEAAEPFNAKLGEKIYIHPKVTITLRSMILFAAPPCDAALMAHFVEAKII
jgi:hypothetical protein